MNRIDVLISELCPSGVTFRRLGDVARIRNGRDYKALGQGNIPVYGTGGVMTTVDTAAYAKPSVLIPRKGSLDKLYYVDVPFWTVDTIFYTEVGDLLVPKFFYYFLITRRLERLNQAGGIPSLTQAVLNEIQVPVPPLGVQQEIVRVLDLFQSLEAELEAELEARRRQYAYYRDSLLTFREAGVRWIPMGDIGEFIRGRRFNKDDVAKAGIPAIHYGEIYTHYGVSASSVATYLRPDIKTNLRYARPGDVVIVDVGETVEDVGKAVAWLGDEDVAIHDHSFAFRHSQDPSYVSYCLQSSWFQLEKAKYVARTKVKTLSMSGLAKVRLPIPALPEQERIVAILDSFDALVNDLTIGLPAEIAARRKQYEYYRDRLLAFEEAA